MKTAIVYLYLFCFANVLTGQISRTTNAEFEQKIDALLSETIPFAYVEELKQKSLDNLILLDAREWEEYKVSHIANAKFIGYKNPDFTNLHQLSKDMEVIVYCSIGYRSEKIAEKLKSQGFTNVRNLYGSIFEWVNQGQEIVDMTGKPTLNIHTYNKRWSKWMINENFLKVW